MRSEPTPAEHRLWQILRAKRLAGYKFKRQLPIDGYIADFACLTQRLIVEADAASMAKAFTTPNATTVWRLRAFASSASGTMTFSTMKRVS